MEYINYRYQLTTSRPRSKQKCTANLIKFSVESPCFGMHDNGRIFFLQARVPPCSSLLLVSLTLIGCACIILIYQYLLDTRNACLSHSPGKGPQALLVRTNILFRLSVSHQYFIYLLQLIVLLKDDSSCLLTGGDQKVGLAYLQTIIII